MEGFLGARSTISRGGAPSIMVFAKRNGSPFGHGPRLQSSFNWGMPGIRHGHGGAFGSNRFAAHALGPPMPERHPRKAESEERSNTVRHPMRGHGREHAP